jgi:phosphoglycolate phosphatase-like HAD superfamily hydrolase
MTSAGFSSSNRTLLLWDIDGTLLDTGGSGVEPFKRAVEKYLGGMVKFDRANMAGKTDYQIVDDLRKKTTTKFPTAFIEHMILREYAFGLRNTLKVNPVEILGDARAALENLSSSSVFELGILTGNCRRGMEAKLESAGLSDLFLETKLFYATRVLRTREQILRNALSRVMQRVVLIGDTPSDVRAAIQLSTPILSIATGFFKYAELSELNPNRCLDKGWSCNELILKLNAIREH